MILMLLSLPTNLQSGEFLLVKDAYLALEVKVKRHYSRLEEAFRDIYCNYSRGCFISSDY